MLSLLLMLPLGLRVQAQDWEWHPGYYYDLNNIKHTGLVQVSTFDNGTAYGTSKFKSSEFFRFKTDEKSPQQELYALDVQSVVVGADSIVVRHWFRTDRKGRVKKDTAGNEYSVASFLKVELNSGETKVYSKLLDGNNYGTYTGYYYGKNADNINDINTDTFAQVMSDIVKDAPDLVEKINKEDFKLRKMEKLINAYKTKKGITL